MPASKAHGATHIHTSNCYTSSAHYHDNSCYNGTCGTYVYNQSVSQYWQDPSGHAGGTVYQYIYTCSGCGNVKRVDYKNIYSTTGGYTYYVMYRPDGTSQNFDSPNFTSPYNQKDYNPGYCGAKTFVCTKTEGKYYEQDGSESKPICVKWVASIEPKVKNQTVVR